MTPLVVLLILVATCLIMLFFCSPLSAKSTKRNHVPKLAVGVAFAMVLPVIGGCLDSVNLSVKSKGKCVNWDRKGKDVAASADLECTKSPPGKETEEGAVQ